MKQSFMHKSCMQMRASMTAVAYLLVLPKHYGPSDAPVAKVIGFRIVLYALAACVWHSFAVLVLFFTIVLHVVHAMSVAEQCVI